MKRKIVILGMTMAFLLTGCSSQTSTQTVAEEKVESTSTITESQDDALTEEKVETSSTKEQNQEATSTEEKENALEIERQYYDKIDRGIGEVKIRSNFDNCLEILEVIYKDVKTDNGLEPCILIHYSMNNQYGNPVEDYFLWYSNQDLGVQDYKDNFEDALKSAEGKNEDHYPNKISDTHYTSDDDEHIFIVDLEDLEENE